MMAINILNRDSVIIHIKGENKIGIPVYFPVNFVTIKYSEFLLAKLVEKLEILK